MNNNNNIYFKFREEKNNVFLSNINNNINNTKELQII